MFTITPEQTQGVMLARLAEVLGIRLPDLQWQVRPDGVFCDLWDNHTGKFVIEGCENILKARNQALQRWFDMNEATPF